MRRVADDLIAAYGPIELRPSGDPIGELVGTILSQNTSDVNSGRAYDSLHAAFADWDAVLAAPEQALAASIVSGGLAVVKARRIQAALRTILDRRGALDLDFLRDLPVAEGRAWLEGLPGVGAKTANCVLLFALGLPAMPVDTHVERVSTRLGLVPARTSPAKIGEALEAALPADVIGPVHLHFLTHGRRVCLAARPRCPQCMFRDWCPAAKLFAAAGVETTGAQG